MDELDESDESEADIDGEIQLPDNWVKGEIGDEQREDDPTYDDLLDSGWIDRAARVEEMDDEHVNSLDFGVTLDLSGSNDQDDSAQMVDLDVGPLLTSLPFESELDRDAVRDLAAHDSSFAVGALRDLLLPDTSNLDNSDEPRIDDEQFPAFDATSPSSRPDVSDASDHEGIPDEDAQPSSKD